MKSSKCRLGPIPPGPIPQRGLIMSTYIIHALIYIIIFTFVNTSNAEHISIQFVYGENNINREISCVVHELDGDEHVMSYTTWSNDAGVLQFDAPVGRKIIVAVSSGDKEYFGEKEFWVKDSDEEVQEVELSLSEYVTIRGNITSSDGEAVYPMGLQLYYKEPGYRGSISGRTDVNGWFSFAKIKDADGLILKGKGDEWCFDWQDVEPDVTNNIIAKRCDPKYPNVYCNIISTDGESIDLNGNYSVRGDATGWHGEFEKGRFILSGVKPGKYEVKHLSDKDGNIIVLRNSMIELAKNDTLINLIAEDMVKERVKVVDRETKEPIENSEINITQFGKHYKAVTDRQGNCSLEMWPSKYAINVNSKGYLSYNDVIDEYVSGIIISMQKGQTLKGTIINHSGNPVENAYVIVRQSNGGEKVGQTDQQGGFDIGGLAGTKFSISVVTEDYPRTTFEDVRAEEGNVELALVDGIPLSLNIRGDKSEYNGYFFLLNEDNSFACDSFVLSKKDEDSIIVSGGVVHLFYCDDERVFSIRSIKVDEASTIDIELLKKSQYKSVGLDDFYNKLSK
ncbi:MAG: carboxypeptidase regulatory-like domain-containing protein [Pontiellaceae bacterium]|nr:carboxypeptidase regulatory-like domain-containing protein [Pontiellaceae bacterium]